MTFEIGGKNKSKKQMSHIEKGFIDKDEIELGFGNIAPHLQFGLTY